MKPARRRTSTPSTACRSCYHLDRSRGGGARCSWLDVAIVDPRKETCADFIDRERGGDVEGGIPCAGWTGGRPRQLDFLAVLDNSTNETPIVNQGFNSSTRSIK